MNAQIGWLLLTATAGIAVMVPTMARAVMPVVEKSGSRGGGWERDPSRPIRPDVKISDPKPRERTAGIESSPEARQARHNLVFNAFNRGKATLKAAERDVATSKKSHEAVSREVNASRTALNEAKTTAQREARNEAARAAYDKAKVDNAPLEAKYRDALKELRTREARVDQLKGFQEQAMNAADAQRKGYVPAKPGLPRFESARPSRFVQPVAVVAKSPREALKPAREPLNNPSHYANAGWAPVDAAAHYANAFSDIRSVERDGHYADPRATPELNYADAGFISMAQLNREMGVSGVRQNGAGGAAPLNVDAVSAQANQDQGAVPSRANQPKVMFQIPGPEARRLPSAPQ